MHQPPDIKKNGPKEVSFCLKRAIYKGRRELCVNFKIDTDKMNFVVYRCRNKLYHKFIEIDPKKTEYQMFLAKQTF